MRHLTKRVIYILMQVTNNANICHAVRPDAAYCFGLCCFGIEVERKVNAISNFIAGMCC